MRTKYAKIFHFDLNFKINCLKNNTNFLKVVLKDILTPDFTKDVACITICIGANDSWQQNLSATFNLSVPVDKYKNNLKEIIDCVTRNGISKDKIILITPPSIDVEAWSIACEQYKKLWPGFVGLSKTPEDTKMYSDCMIEVGKDLGITVLNSFELTNKEENRKKAFLDGLHFSTFGAELIFNLIKDEVNERVKKFRNTDLENFPVITTNVDLLEIFK